MFSNCRQYNEEGSNIYEDANILERALNEKLKEFPGLSDVKKPQQKYSKVGRKLKTALITERLWQFYESVKEYQEPKGKRQLSLIFTKLPSKNEYPDYYDIIIYLYICYMITYSCAELILIFKCCAVNCCA